MNPEEAIKVIQLVRELITPASRWTKEGEFGQDCKINQEAFTFGCALELMQLSATGEYHSRNLVMRRVRRKIRRHFFFRQGFHPIHSFNKHQKTTYEDMMFLIDRVEDSLR